mmetsp:Transcript_4777/g.14497  ORF Transcript_4777/g.14497 Transcript_4777/m.14497 type:complete len:81 (-) Transcript_4777:913-1155(-)|eukprot:286757-Chlamydomonas_euryale.AAC.3
MGPKSALEHSGRQPQAPTYAETMLTAALFLGCACAATAYGGMQRQSPTHHVWNAPWHAEVVLNALWHAGVVLKAMHLGMQ